MASYVKKNLMNNEEIIHMAKVHWFIFIPGITTIILSIIIMSKGISMADEVPNVAVPATILFIVLLIGGFLSLAKAFIFKISTELAVTTKRVIAKTGFISRDTVELNHSRVESFTVDQSIFGRIFNFGSIVIRGMGGGKTPIPNIDDPLRFRKEAMEIIDKVENANSND